MFLSAKPKTERELCYMLAGEAYDSVHFQYSLESNDIHDLLKKSFRQYDYYESYASEKCVVFIYDSLTHDIKHNIDVEMSAMYIVELVILQNAAIKRTSNRIIELLSSESKATYREIERLYIEFGHTIRLWETCNYKYIPAQNFANGIYKAFKTEQLLKEYIRYQAHLEKIVELRSIRSNTRNNGVLNFILTFLAVMETMPLFIELYSYSSRTHIMNWFVIGCISIVSLVIITSSVIIIHINRHN